MGRVTVLPCIPKAWASDFEADTVGEVPANWIEVNPPFRARDDQARTGSQSARIDGQSSSGRRLILCEPAQMTIAWAVRVQGGGETRVYMNASGDNPPVGNLALIVGRSHFRYTDPTAWRDVPNSPAPVANTWYDITGYWDAVTDRVKYVINGNDSGWLAFRKVQDYFISFGIGSTATFYPTYAWIDEVEYTPSIP